MKADLGRQRTLLKKLKSRREPTAKLHFTSVFVRVLVLVSSAESYLYGCLGIPIR